MTNLHIVIRPDDIDGGYIAECLDIPGCMSEGDTEEEALANIREAIDLCLEARRDEGLPLTVPVRQVEVLGASCLPQLSGQEIVTGFEKAGWRAARQKGSHVVMVKARHFESLSVPLHDRVGRGLLRDLIRKAGLSVDEFVEML